MIILVAGIGVLLSVTLLFNIKNIVVKGDVDYTDEDIIRVSGIGYGDNLVRLDSKKASESILSSMIFIEKAEIDKQYPDTLVINVSRCIATADLSMTEVISLCPQTVKYLINRTRDLKNCCLSRDLNRPMKPGYIPEIY